MTIKTIVFFSKELPCNVPDVLEAAVNETGIVEVYEEVYIVTAQQQPQPHQNNQSSSWVETK